MARRWWCEKGPEAVVQATRMLQAQNVVCEVLEDGCDVAAMLTPAHELLLLDIVMRQSDGVEVCRRPSAHERARALARTQ